MVVVSWKVSLLMNHDDDDNNNDDDDNNNDILDSLRKQCDQQQKKTTRDRPPIFSFHFFWVPFFSMLLLIVRMMTIISVQNEMKWMNENWLELTICHLVALFFLILIIFTNFRYIQAHKHKQTIGQLVCHSVRLVKEKNQRKNQTTTTMIFFR